LYAARLDARSSCTNVFHSVSCTGAGLPFEQVRPATVSSSATSASASALFSTASHLPKTPVSGSVDREPA
jgi:hypothetical protein